MVQTQKNSVLLSVLIFCNTNENSHHFCPAIETECNKKCHMHQNLQKKKKKTW